MSDRPADAASAEHTRIVGQPGRSTTSAPEFRYVEEFVRYQLSQSLGGLRGMLESAAPFIGFTVAWVATRHLYVSLGVAIGTAVILAVIRLAQRQSLKYVAQ